MSAERIHEGIYLVGSSDMTDPKDCCIYLVEFPSGSVLVDAGAGDSVEEIIRNVKDLGLDPGHIRSLILTHCHIDHIGGANELKGMLGLEIIAHEECARILLRSDPLMTAARWYGIEPEPVKVDGTFSGPDLAIEMDGEHLNLIHIPGHSPDSIAAWIDRSGKRVLFGQDVHGPIHPALGSDAKLYEESLRKLIDLRADILCEGHFGIYQPASRVEQYIRSYLA